MNRTTDVVWRGLGAMLSNDWKWRRRAFPILGILLSAGLAQAATNWTYVVTNAVDGGIGSLRDKLTQAAGNVFYDSYTIAFNLAPPYRIVVTGSLPAVTAPGGRPVLVDGVTQPGYTGAPLVQLVAGPGVAGDGLHLFGSGASVQALRISGFTNGSGIVMNNDSNRATGCWIMSNNVGISASGPNTNVVIGGTAATNRNVISANKGAGLSIGFDTHALVRGNFIGVDPTGLADLGNGGDGIAGGGTGSIIGGATTNARNVISGNAGDGLNLQGGSDVSVQGNFIGVDATGLHAIGNGGPGIRNYSTQSTIGGTTAGGRNVISGNGGTGIWLVYAAGSGGSEVYGNFIGVDATGTNKIANGGSGIYVTSLSNTIGGGSAAYRNIIAGNAEYGIWLDNASNSFTTVQNNWIGLGTNGEAISNGTMVHAGLVVESHQNIVAFNVISGNAGSGVYLAGGRGNLLAGNIVGLDPSGSAARGNGGAGVVVGANASSNQIGSVSFRNVISGNGAQGVYVASPGATSNAIVSNFIGTDLTGRLPVGNNQSGVLVDNAAGTAITGNLIADNYGGIKVAGASVRDTRIDLNLIGLDSTGTNNLANASYGIEMAAGSGHSVGIAGRNVVAGNLNGEIGLFGPLTNIVVAGNYIGVTTNGATGIGKYVGLYFGGVTGSALAVSNNVISGQPNYGLYVYGGTLSNVVIAGNLIGLSAAGTAAVSNKLGAIELFQTGNIRIGGATSAERNVIAGYGFAGVRMRGCGSNGPVVIAGNYIGLTSSGAMLPGAASEVGIWATNSPGVQIGGSSTLWKNVIGDNNVGVENFGGHNWWISYNFIGTDPSATLARGNGYGVIITGGTHSNLVENNIIAGNTQSGINVTESSRWATLRGNRIGYGSIAALPNGGLGVMLQNASDCLIGGEDPADGNRIAFNANVGVLVSETVAGQGPRNRVLGNLVYSNAAPDIDIGLSGSTPNDPAPDADSGANGLQNHPDLLFASAGASNISGRMIGAPTSLRLEFFALSPESGLFFIGATNLVNAPFGTSTFSYVFHTAVPSGSVVLATATSSEGTSEYSLPIPTGTALDTDGDRMPDWWEIANLLSYTASNAINADADGDGVTDLGEWIADTHPTDADSLLRIASETGGAPWTIQFQSSGGRVYSLESAPSPLGPWALVQTNVPGNGAMLALQDLQISSQSVYRIGARLP